MSVAQTWFGAEGENCRFNTFLATGRLCVLTVVTLYLRFCLTLRFSVFIKRRVRSRPIPKPSWLRLFISVRLPKLPRETVNDAFMRRLNPSSCGATTLPGCARHA